MAVDLQLGYAQAASLRTAHLLVLSAAQIPIAASASAARETAVLGGSLTWFGASYVALGAGMTFVGALTWVAVAGARPGTYHPVATNRIAHIADARNRGRALGTLNFLWRRRQVSPPRSGGRGGKSFGRSRVWRV